jgi:Porin subfamily
MKMVKSLILGSAAGLLAMSGAQAADLPVKAKAVEYVRICSLYGAGFWYIPGTDTCMRISGYIRAEADINGGPFGQPSYGGVLGNSDRYSDNYTAYARGSLTFDTRTASEYGVVRALVKFNENFTTNQNYNTAAQLGAAISGPQGNEQGRGGGSTSVDYAFIQFAGFTFGKSVSAFETPWFGNGFGNGGSFLIGGSDDVTGIPQIAYTAQFGNGVSASVAVEDGSVYRRGILTNMNAGSNLTSTMVMNTGVSITPTVLAGTTNACSFLPYGTTNDPVISSGTSTVQCGNPTTGWGNSYGGAKAPDFSGNVRFDSAFVTAQISGAAHLVNASYNVTSNGSDPLFQNVQSGASATPILGGAAGGAPDSKWGGAIAGGLQFKQLPTGAGDTLTIDAIGAKGATAYVVSGTNPTAYYMYGGSKSGNSLGSTAFGNVTDGVFGAQSSNATLNARFLQTGGAISLTNAWAVRAGFTHNWTPQWSSSIFGSWSQISYDGTAKTTICNAFSVRLPGTTGIGAAGAGIAGLPVAVTSAVNSTAGTSNGYACNPDWGTAQVGGRVAWTPVKNLTFSVEAMYTNLMQNMVGQAYMNPSATSGRNSGIYDFANQSTVQGYFRVERQF